ncbi:hypothetical protein [Streptomyces sp. NPDC088261]
MFGTYTEAQLAAADTPALSPSLHTYLNHLPGMENLLTDIHRRVAPA